MKQGRSFGMLDMKSLKDLIKGFFQNVAFFFVVVGAILLVIFLRIYSAITKQKFTWKWWV